MFELSIKSVSGFWLVNEVLKLHELVFITLAQLLLLLRPSNHIRLLADLLGTLLVLLLEHQQEVVGVGGDSHPEPLGDRAAGAGARHL